jgi:hypothetical protein
MNFNAFTIAHADRQWFYDHRRKPPPRAAGLLRPLSTKLVPGYDHRVAETSILRGDVGAYAQTKVGRDLHDREVLLFSV